MHEDGSLFDVEGYDPKTRIYYAPAKGFRLGVVPEHPTAEDVQIAVAGIMAPFSEMRFASDADSANWIAALMTVVIRSWFPTVPFIVIEATIQGSGKTLLAMIIQLLSQGSTGVGAAPPSGRDSENEWRKRITSILLKAPMVAIFDNVVGTLGCPTLSALATSPVYSDRLLGGNKVPDLPNTPTWIFTTNNAVPDLDFSRRCFYVRLDTDEPRPWLRSGFAIPDLLEHIAERRGAILAHVYTLVRHWIDQGRPDAPSGTPELGSFTKWSKVVPAILGAAGVTGVLGDLEGRARDLADPDQLEMVELLSAWHEIASIRDGVTASKLGGLPDIRFPSFAFGRGGRDGDPSSLARRLTAGFKFRRGRWYDAGDGVNFCVRAVGGSNKRGLMWKVERRDSK